MSQTKKHHLIRESFISIDNMFMNEIVSIVNAESEMVIFIDIDQNSIPNSVCVYSFTKRDLLG